MFQKEFYDPDHRFQNLKLRDNNSFQNNFRTFTKITIPKRLENYKNILVVVTRAKLNSKMGTYQEQFSTKKMFVL